MLPDHRQEQERRASAARCYRRVISEYGSFLAWLRFWAWFMTITLRDWPSATAPMATREPVNTSRHQRCEADRRIDSWTPSRRGGMYSNDPACDLVRRKIIDFLQELQIAAGGPIAWVMAEDFGRINGRWHAHALVDGVGDLDIDYWRAEALGRFGISRIEPYDPSRGGAWYLAKNGLSEHGNLHFGGALAGLEIDTGATREVGRVVIARSADVPSALYHMSLGRRRIR